MQKKRLFISELEDVFDSLIEGIMNHGECHYKLSGGINPTLLSAYLTSKHDGKNILDFGLDLIPEEVEEIAPLLLKYGITAFTIPAPLTAPNTKAIIEAFSEFGFAASGTVSVKNLNGAETHSILMEEV